MYLAVDVGGTNVRVCAVELHGDTTYTNIQSKVAIPRKVMSEGTSRTVFGFIALQVQKFLEENDLTKRFHVQNGGHNSNSSHHDSRQPLGFTFSFAVEQHALDRGTLVKWTKGFDIPDTVGKEVCSLFQAELDRLNLPVVVTALTNDTVGTLMARAYTSPDHTRTLLGAIFGTGTNGAYVEKSSEIRRLCGSTTFQSSPEMIVNTEWGGFDDELSVLQLTAFDRAIDESSVNPGDQRFEKLVSGMYLGEILRRSILGLIDRASAQGVRSFDMVIPASSRLYTQWAIDTSLLSTLAADTSETLSASRTAIEQALGCTDVSVTDAKALQIISAAIGRRSARLAGVAIAGVVLQSGRLGEMSRTYSRGKPTELPQDPETTIGCMDRVFHLIRNVWTSVCGKPTRATFSSIQTTSSMQEEEKKANTDIKAVNLLKQSSESISTAVSASDTQHSDIIDIGLDGSLVEHYPDFVEMMRSTLREVDEIGPRGDARIRFGLAKDGSGVGAALVAQAAMAASMHSRVGMA